MVGFKNLLPELSAVGAKVVAASVDSLENAKIVADEVGFPIGYGVTREIAELLGAWWQNQRNCIQPAEFVLDKDGKIVASSYSDGPIGRIDAADVLKLIKFYESRK